jgi:hypothetical protein
LLFDLKGGFGARDLNELLDMLVSDIAELPNCEMPLGEHTLTRWLRYALREMVLRAERTKIEENRWWKKTCSEGVLLYNSQQMQIDSALLLNCTVSEAFFSTVAKGMIAQFIINRNMGLTLESNVRAVNDIELREPEDDTRLADKRAAAVKRKKKQLSAEVTLNSTAKVVARKAARNKKKKEARKRQKAKSQKMEESMLGKRTQLSSDVELDLDDSECS